LVTLLCTVRGCLQPLEQRGRSYHCANRHHFDLARSGYLNLLQPQDRRSARPGDREEAVKARRRLFDRDFGSELTRHLDKQLESMAVGADSAVLDVGCGEGTYLGRLYERRSFEAHGVDLSVEAVDLAAKRYRQPMWTVANADRFLPYADESFDVAMSITSRRHSSEFRRVLKKDGRLIIAIPAPDDLVELRSAVMMTPTSESRVAAVVAELAEAFEVVTTSEVREQLLLDREALLDVLAATYRGARKSQQERVEGLDQLLCTFSYDVVVFRPS
jgi:23S rRNA (guanine745-N1)-methyltransferase